MIDSFSGTYRWLSNFWWMKDGTTVEHLYQAAKCVDIDAMDEIMAAETPAIAKKLGRQVELRPGWEQMKDDVMLRLVRRKFWDPTLAQKLLDTGNRTLIEGNYWHDRYWGACYCNACGGEGQNKLGHILMQVRKELKERNENKTG